MFKKYFIILVVAFWFLSFSQNVLARNSEDITDWYIQNFETNIVVNRDSSLFITENITADCGNLLNKHGIFRVLPTEVKTDHGVLKNPIELVSITDFNNNPYKYQTIKSSNTVTWKIGDADKTVSGVNYYRITYKVKNAVRFGNANFDELYWNLSGNYWDIGIDNFSAKISFPEGVSSQSSQVDYYTGVFGSKDKSSATYFWDANNVLNFNAVYVLYPNEGVTVSVTFSKNIFIPYIPTFMEKYGHYFWYLSYLIPLGIFIFSFLKWKKYGEDPKMKKPIPPEFGIPENINPIQMGMVLSHGKWRNNFITAAIVDLAVKKFITIEQKEEKVLFFATKEITLRKNIENYNLENATLTENILLEKLFGGDKNSVKLSTLKNNFYKYLPTIKKAAKNDTIAKGWITTRGHKYSVRFILFGVVTMWLSIWTAPFQSSNLVFSILLSGIILLLFGIIMPKRTQVGVDLLFKIKGFERYMRQAEDYRQQFYEKENIFDKFLPYAIVFGIAELWAKKMEIIYGEEYFKNYHPVWFVGSTSSSFNLSSFTSQLNSITTSINSSTSGSSGSGGGGSSGGGGGGGGGGGW